VGRGRVKTGTYEGKFVLELAGRSRFLGLWEPIRLLCPACGVIWRVSGHKNRVRSFSDQ
jgi:hypothetical protein